MNEIVTFGKYKGQPVEAMAQDKQYVDWLLAQDWVKTRYQGIYNIIINNFQAPSETPEHNIIQAKFLDDAYVMAFIRVAWPGIFELSEPVCDCSRFELEGMDVYLRIKYRVLEALTEDDLKFHRYDDKLDIGDEQLMLVREMQIGQKYISRGHIEVYIEIKPMLGDDYPAVLRQIKASPAYNRSGRHGYGYILYIDSFSASITPDQLTAIFAKDSIRVVFQQDIERLLAG